MSTNTFLNTKPRNFKPTKINDFTVTVLQSNLISQSILFLHKSQDSHFKSKDQNNIVLPQKKSFVPRKLQFLKCEVKLTVQDKKETKI